MTLLKRRRTLLGKERTEIPIDVNLYTKDAEDVIDGYCIGFGQKTGTTIISLQSYSAYLITAPLPYNTKNKFYTNGVYGNSGMWIVTDKAGFVIYTANNAGTFSQDAKQEAIRDAEISFGKKAAFVRFSTTDKSRFVYKRTE